MPPRPRRLRRATAARGRGGESSSDGGEFLKTLKYRWERGTSCDCSEFYISMCQDLRAFTRKSVNKPRPDRPNNCGPSPSPLPSHGRSVGGWQRRAPLVEQAAPIEVWLRPSSISDSYDCRIVRASQSVKIYWAGTYGSTFGFFGMRSLSTRSSSSSLVLRVGNFLLRSEKEIR